MKMLTIKAREYIDAIAKDAGMAPGDALNGLLESVLPTLDKSSVVSILVEAVPLWTQLEPGESCEIELGLGEEASFRAKLRRFKTQNNQLITTKKRGRSTLILTRLS